ncbi:MAG TPA: hypothetical protein VFY69_06255 [Solirubrobacterales bacterium]|nr:hypothetical protein [Solirubrobacterales bacterium]
MSAESASTASASPGEPSSASQASAWISGGEPLEPLSRRLLQAAGFLSFLLVAVLANSFLQSSEENPLNPVAMAAERTQSEPGARFTMKALYTSPQLPQPMTATGHGAYSSETGRSSMTLNMDMPQVGPVKMEMVGDGTTMYMRMDEVLGQLPGGKEWMEIEPFGGVSEDELMVGGGDAESSLRMLSACGGVEEMGREKVRGVATRRYRATVNLAAASEVLHEEGKDELADQFDEYVAVAPSAPVVEVSIDKKEIVRRFRMVMEMPAIDGQPAMTMDMRMELFDFGAEPQIELPDPSRVFDATALQEQLD